MPLDPELDLESQPQQWIWTPLAVATPAAGAKPAALPMRPLTALITVKPICERAKFEFTVSAHWELAMLNMLPSLASQARENRTHPFQRLSERKREAHRKLASVHVEPDLSQNGY